MNRLQSSHPPTTNHVHFPPAAHQSQALRAVKKGGIGCTGLSGLAITMCCRRSEWKEDLSLVNVFSVVLAQLLPGLVCLVCDALQHEAEL